VSDDVMDNSLTRRGQPCWYKQVGQPSAIITSVKNALLISVLYVF